MDQKYQIWGTFSVKDHVREGAFISEVLMYDKLVVPVPPRLGVGSAKDRMTSAQEWERWKMEGWDPARQTQLLGILGKLAMPVEWNRKWQDEWQSTFQKSRSNVSEEIARRLAFIVTGSVLLKLTPAMAEGVVAVTPYDSLEEIKQDLGIQARQFTSEDQERSRHLPGSALTAIVGREFLVPEDADKDDFQLLADAVAVAKSDGYREARAALHTWLKKFLASGETDVVSIEAAVKDMENHLEALRKASARQKLWTGVRRCLFVGKTAAPLAPLPGAMAVAVDGAISVGQYISNDLLSVPNPGVPHGALFLDAQNKLGLTIHGDRAPSRWEQILGKLGD